MYKGKEIIMPDNKEKDINDIIAEAMKKRAERMQQGGGIAENTENTENTEKGEAKAMPQKEHLSPTDKRLMELERMMNGRRTSPRAEAPKPVAEEAKPAAEEAPKTERSPMTEEAKAAQIMGAINAQSEPQIEQKPQEPKDKAEEKGQGSKADTKPYDRPKAQPAPSRHTEDDDERYEHREHHGGKRQAKKKWTTKKKVLLVLLIILLIIMIAIAAVGIYIMTKLDKVNVVDRTYDNSIYDSIEIDPGEYVQPNGSSVPDSPDSVIDELQSQIDSNVQSSTPIRFSDDVLNILLIGTDARTHDYRGRSDSMILVSIHKETKQIVMTSIMRDIYIMIPGIGYSKLNHSYAWGGADLLIQTIESNFKIRIDKFVQVDFLSFESVIDAVGGVDMYINAAEMETLKDVIPNNHGEGMYHLNGKQALRFARIRYVGNADFERTQRQRRVLQEILKKAQDLSIFELNDLLDTMLPLLTTDMSKGEMLDLIMHSVSYLGYERVEQRVPADGMWWSVWVDGMDCLGIDFNDSIKKMQGVIYGD